MIAHARLEPVKSGAGVRAWSSTKTASAAAPVSSPPGRPNQKTASTIGSSP
jgi:hypothetical protein